jgi:hypothetical protein
MHRSLIVGSLVLALCACNLNGTADLCLSEDLAGRACGSPPARPDVPPEEPPGTEQPPGTGVAPLNCDARQPGPMPLRRLSHVEYRFALEDLFGRPALAQQAAQMLVSDPTSLGFSNSATLLDVKPVLAQQYMEAAEAVAEELVKDLGALLPCAPASADFACATAFIQALGHKAYRRPLSATEEAAYVQTWQALRTQYDVKTGVEWVVATLLQSPHFLYRAELDAEGEGGVRAVRPDELAQRLSFLIWHSGPDAALLAAVAEGKLSTPEDVEREARRLLADPRGARFLNFFNEWLDLDKLGPYLREPASFPGLPADLKDLFRQETQAFVHHVVREGGGKLEDLLTADYTFANATLAQHYGLTGVTGASFQKVSLPPGRRGVWMQGGPLSAHDKSTRTSIVNRGVRVRTALLCHNIPAPPDDVSLTLGPVDQNASQAERLAQHRADPTCASCHNLIDPLGQPFENVDAVGRLRTVDEAGRPLDTQGQVTSTDDANGTVEDGQDLMLRLAQSEQVRACFATQLFRYAFGREEKAFDACTRKQALDTFAASGYDVRELVVGLVRSDAFLYREVSQ